MATENQWEFVRKRLKATPREDWAMVAHNAGITHRTLYNVMDPESHPRYQTVYDLYVSLKAEAAARRAAK